MTETDRAMELLERVLYLRMYGENAPGHGPRDNWRSVDTDLETFLREVDGVVQ